MAKSKKKMLNLNQKLLVLMSDHGNITLPLKDRAKILPHLENAVEFNIPLCQYFHSGVQVIYMASVYSEENDTEHAFILYSKYIKSFREKSPGRRTRNSLDTHTKECEKYKEKKEELEFPPEYGHPARAGERVKAAPTWSAERQTNVPVISGLHCMYGTLKLCQVSPVHQC
ncbi:hypothetical protein A6R68_16820 [Neotoma lepida]|uniref:USP8 dimerisation domain-containing protein n=1 Tax=Neotoma lepida TaxID=56216 RepID=A0A1A6HEP5_NEOLE|nr:hypothetical protein A6R68_16820 [Neotoma lepida]